MLLTSATRLIHADLQNGRLGPATCSPQVVGPLCATVQVMEIEGYRRCSQCDKPVLDYVAYLTRGVCFDPCFLKGDMQRFRELEIVARGNVVTQRFGAAESPARRKTKRAAQQNRQPKRDLARLRACRRVAALFPDIFALLLADERHKAGIGPKVSNVEGQLARAVETYTAIAAYHAEIDRSDHGATRTA